MSLKVFVDSLPLNTNILALRDQSKFGLTKDSYEYFMIWNEHDAIHYLMNLGFDKNGELIVAKIEKELNCGFSKIRAENVNNSNKILNEFEYKSPDWLTYDLITKTAYKIKDCYFGWEINRG